MGGQTYFVHPFRREMFEFESDPDIITELSMEQSKFDSLVADKKWSKALDLIESKNYAFQFLIRDIEPKLPSSPKGDIKYWKLLRKSLRNNCTHYDFEREENNPDIIKALSSGRSRKQEGLNGKDDAEFKRMSEPITGWRGIHATSRNLAEEAIRSGLSWTLDKKKADWFSKRNPRGESGTAYIAKSIFQKEQIVAFFPSLGEGEFVVKPSPDLVFTLDELKSEDD